MLLVGACSLGVLAACGAETPTSAGPTAEAGFGARNGGSSAVRTYQVTIDNLTGGQPLTPPLVATHQRAADLFDVGSSASTGIREIAENGNLAPLKTILEGSDHVSSVVVAVAGTPPPVMPGAGVTFTIQAEPGARFLSFASMLICTNDGFTGLDSVRLPSQVGDSFNRDLNAYDAGTEMNTEDFADMVPPCPALTGVPSTDPGSGTSDPTIAENDVIRMHSGVVGIADLQPGVHGFSSPVGQITVTRVN